MAANNEVHTWMMENNIQYGVDVIEGHPCYEWLVTFEKADDAILFKLTWVGR